MSAIRRDGASCCRKSIWHCGSLNQYKADCSLRTWVYRVAHNVGVSHIQRSLRNAERHSVTLDEIDSMPSDATEIAQTERRLDLQKVMALIHRLAPLDRQVMLLYLEDMDAAGIADITGLSARNVATKVHRIKAVLAKQLGIERKTA
jgi:RNA polymerase sigma-70 factor (ECF subfamily)